MDQKVKQDVSQATSLLRGAQDPVQDPLEPSICICTGGSGIPQNLTGKNKKNEGFFIKWLSIVYLEPVNPTLTIGI